MWPDPAAVITPIIAVLAYLLPERTPEAWAVKTAIVGASLLVTAGWQVARGADSRHRGAVLPWVGVAAWLALTAAWSGDPGRTVFQAITVGAAAMLVVTGCPASPRLLAAALLVPALIETVAAQAASSGPAGVTLRASGTFVNADHFAACLLMGLAVLFALVAMGGRRRMGWRAGGLLVLAASAGASASRAAVVAALAVAAGAWWWTRDAGTLRRWGLATAATAAGFAAAPALAVRLADQAIGREAMAWGRLDLWRTGLHALSAAPVVGTGLGTFAAAFAAARPESMAALATDYAHCEPLQLGVETGVVGLGLAAWGLVALARMARQWRPADAVTLGLGLAALAVMVFAVVDFPLHAPAIAVPGLLAAVGATGSRRLARAAPFRWSTGAVWLVTGAAVLWIVATGVADSAYAGGVRLALGGDLAGAHTHFSAALAASPQHAGALQALAELEPDDPQAPGFIGRAARLRPGWPDVARTAFDASLRRGDRTAAAAALDRSVRLDPWGLETRLAQVRWLASSGRLDAAGRVLASAERIWPTQLDVWYAKADLAERSGRRAEAQRLLRHILRIYPSAEYARDWLGRLTP